MRVRGDRYIVDLGSNTSAQLSSVGFANASKKVRPELVAGDLVLTKVIQTDPNSTFEVSCIDTAMRENSLGPLPNQNSYLIPVDIFLARK